MNGAAVAGRRSRRSRSSTRPRRSPAPIGTPGCTCARWCSSSLVAVVALASASHRRAGGEQLQRTTRSSKWPPCSAASSSACSPRCRSCNEQGPETRHRQRRWPSYWITGGLSSVLDNAPTYVVFFETAKHACLLIEGSRELIAGVSESRLVAISLGAVFMGAMTYIGNGPNFMVKRNRREVGRQDAELLRLHALQRLSAAADPRVRRLADAAVSRERPRSDR